jgi:hypothetical protein
MMGKLQWLTSGVLLAAAMMLAGCLAPVDDSEAEVDEAIAAVEEVDFTEGATDKGDIATTVNPLKVVNDGAADPEPNPWVPTANASTLPGNPSDPGPSPVESKGK